MSLVVVVVCVGGDMSGECESKGGWSNDGPAFTHTHTQIVEQAVSCAGLRVGKVQGRAHPSSQAASAA